MLTVRYELAIAVRRLELPYTDNARIRIDRNRKTNICRAASACIDARAIRGNNTDPTVDRICNPNLNSLSEPPRRHMKMP